MYVGLGCNLGDREALLREALERLESLPDTRVSAQSRLYVTAPVGGPEQGDFLNQVVELSTSLSVRELFEAVKAIELAMGRERLVKWGPRRIDVDILWYHGVAVDDTDLQVPHPRMAERRFVLEPLSELAPELRLSDGRTVLEALSGVQDQRLRVAAVSRPEED